ncbi:hypothetical protein B0H19DRAFT_1373824 [Mycena capillaripes]|nr:hypothetical protein B0H19DRAFT_1373824 [Mycena capillaripes]
MTPIPHPTEAVCGTSYPTSRLPPYSANLPHGEQSLDRTPGVWQRPSGNYWRKCGRETLILHGQAEDADVPVYGRGARITGAVIIEQSATVADMTLQLRGKMEVTVVDRGCMTTRTLRATYSLWPRDGQGSICPNTLPFSVLLPLSFRDDNYAVNSLPPSYEISLPGFFVKSTYSVSIMVTRNDHKFQCLSLDKTMTVPFHYNPAAGSPTPRLVRASRAFLSDVKAIPEEWRQTLIQLSPLPHVVPVEPLQFSVFLPSAKTVELRDAVPFHIQLTGPAALLQHFHTHDGSWKQIIQCFIQRDIIVNMYGCPTTRSVSIARCNPHLCPFPPRAGASQNAQSIVNSALDWDGELPCDADVRVGAFDGGLIKIQDYIIVELTLPMALVSQISPVRHTQPIIFTSDS